MAKKLKLVPESLYKKLISLNSENEPDLELKETLKTNKTSVLGDNSIPDEVKILLYQQLMRQLIDKEAEEDKKPLLVKTETVKENTTPLFDGKHAIENAKQKILEGTSKRGSKIMEFLLGKGLVINENDVIFMNKTFSIGKMNSFLNAMSHGMKTRNADPEFRGVADYLKTLNPPKTLFTAAVANYIFGQQGQGRKKKGQFRWSPY